MKITLLDTVTSEVEIVDSIVIDELEVFNFWIDGNFACDCNRATFFGVECECGTGRFIITGPFELAEADKERL